MGKVDLNVVVSVASFVVTLFVLAVQMGYWGGGMSERAKPGSRQPRPEDEPKGSGRNRWATPQELERVEQRAKEAETGAREARAIAHDGRNIANVTKGKLDELTRATERDIERIDDTLRESTRRIDEVVRSVMRSTGESV